MFWVDAKFAGCASVFSVGDRKRCVVFTQVRKPLASPDASHGLNAPAQIKGMEEGMHSMRVGGKRRVIMPQGLGYTVQGLGPYPADPRKRDVLVQVNTSATARHACAAQHTCCSPEESLACVAAQSTSILPVSRLPMRAFNAHAG